MKLRHGLLAAGLLVTAALAFFDDKTTDGGVAEPVARDRTRAVALAASSRSAASAAQAAPVILALLPRGSPMAPTLDALAEDALLFRSRSWSPPPVPPPAEPVKPPAAPTLPFTYIGKAAMENGQWQVFLASGDRTLVVHATQIVDEHYRIDAIVPPLLTMTYLPLKQIQQLNIGVSN